MIRVKDVLNFLDDRFPLSDACDFDNVGLLAGDENNEVKKILVCLDADISAVEKAVYIGADLIVTHHPVIFDPLKSVTAESIVFKLIKNDISVISIHTNFDVGNGGVNDILCSLLPLKNVKKFEAADGYILNSAESEISDAFLLADKIKDILGFPVRYVAGRPIKKLLVCSGAGGDFLPDVICGGFDALITSDVKHNRFVEARNNNVSLFDAGHYATENVCVKPLSEMLKKEFSIETCPYSPDFIKCN